MSDHSQAQADLQPVWSVPPPGPAREQLARQLGESALALGWKSEAALSPAPEKRQASDPLDLAIKLGAIAGFISAFMGFPAAYVRFSNLGIPTTYIDYDLVLHAGVPPAVVAILEYAYFHWVLRPEASRQESPVPHAVVLSTKPLLLFSYATGFTFVVSALWFLLWLATRMLRWLDRIPPSNLSLAVAAGCVVALGYAAYFLRGHIARTAFGQSRLARHIVSFFEDDDEDKPTLTEATVQAAPSNHEETDAPGDLVRDLLVFWVYMPGIVVTELVISRLVAGFAFPGWGDAISFEHVIWAGLGVSFLIALPYSLQYTEYVRTSGEPEARAKGMVVGLCCLLIWVTFFSALYSQEIYPRVSQAWGGGKLAGITAWVDGDALSAEQYQQALPGLKATRVGDVVRIDACCTLRVGESILLLSDGSEARGIAVRAEDAKVRAWGPQ